MDSAITPHNEFEQCIIDALAEMITFDEFCNVFVQCQVFILLDRDLEADPDMEHFNPLALMSTKGFDALVIFSSQELAEGILDQAGDHQYIMVTDVTWIIEGINEGAGLMLNPGTLLAVDIEPQMVEHLQHGQEDRLE